MSTRLQRSESGVTLIELLVAVSLMGMLMAALSGALVVGFRTTRDTHTSLDQSNAEQIISTYVTKDIQRADAIVAPATTICAGQSPQLELRSRSDALATSSNLTIAYALQGGDLIRCVDGAASTVARGLTAFGASGTDTVRIDVATAASSEVGAYSFSLEVRRRQA